MSIRDPTKASRCHASKTPFDIVRCAQFSRLLQEQLGKGASNITKAKDTEIVGFHSTFSIAYRLDPEPSIAHLIGRGRKIHTYQKIVLTFFCVYHMLTSIDCSFYGKESEALSDG